MSAATGATPLRLANFPEDQILAGALAELGARREALQYEMTAKLG